MEFTEQQKKVIETRDKSILVSAAAGSGKTAVLVERIVSLVEDGCDIDRLLVVTFTNAAAAQMRERIGQRLQQKIAEDPLNQRLYRQETLLHNARITTIHSFCNYLIRNHFADIGLDPGFRLMPETERDLLFKDVLGEFIENRYAENDEDFLFCTDYFCQGLTDREMEELLTALFDEAEAHPYPVQYLNERKNDYAGMVQENGPVGPVERYLYNSALTMLEESAQEYAGLLEVMEKPGAPQPYRENLEKEKKALDQAVLALSDNRNSVQDAEACLQLLKEQYEAVLGSYTRLKTITASKYPDVLPEMKDYVQNSRNDIKKRLDNFNKKFLLADPDTEKVRNSLCSRALDALIGQEIRFMELFAERKRERNLIDFGDMEHFALDILLKDGEPTETALLYRKLFDEIMIDEYQDSNEVQELLLRTISGTDDNRFNRFMVGDVKQSIYRFRQARPEIFVSKSEIYQQDTEHRTRIDLDKNFRSRRQVLDSVNGIFSKLMRKEIGGVEYDETQSLKEGALYPDADNSIYDTELLLIGRNADAEDTDADADDREDSEGFAATDDYGDGAESMGGSAGAAADEEAESARTAAEKEAAVIAGRIREMAGKFMVSDGQGGLRPSVYSDYAVLLRGDSGWYDAFRSVFEMYRIPYCLESGTGYFGSAEIKDVLQLLRIVVNPLQDIPFYGAMRSYFGGFTEEDAAWLKIFYRAGSSRDEKDCFLYRAVKAAAETGQPSGQDADAGENVQSGTAGMISPALRNKCGVFLSLIEKYRRESVYQDMESLLSDIIYDTGYMDYCTAMPSGAVRAANLRMLIVRAAEFETTQYSGLFSFLQYVEQMQTYRVDYGEAGVFDENQDAVKILSIHRSKGLEYPVCFVAGLGRKFNKRDSSSVLIMDTDLGFGCNAVDIEERTTSKSLRKQVIADKIARDTLGEELRILYVAMTRAREKLILTGAAKEPEKLAQEPEFLKNYTSGEADPYRALSISQITGAGSFLNLVMRARNGIVAAGGMDPLKITVVPDPQIIDSGQDLVRMHAAKKEALDAYTELFEREGRDAIPDPELYDDLEKRFSFRYAYGNLASLYTKTTVTELKKAAMYRVEESEEEAHRLYSGSVHDVQDTVSRGASYGTAVHRVMELLDERIMNLGSGIDGIDRDTLADWIRALKDEGRMTAEEADLIRPEAILGFFRTSLFERMKAAWKNGVLFREQPFVMQVAANTLNTDFGPDETVLIQGIIDCFFMEKDGIILVDYKTDAVDSERELVRRYSVQLDYYAQALERLFDRKVTGKIIYSFSLNKEIELP